jgi:hypothetical protein
MGNVTMSLARRLVGRFREVIEEDFRVELARAFAKVMPKGGTNGDGSEA